MNGICSLLDYQHLDIFFSTLNFDSSPFCALQGSHVFYKTGCLSVKLFAYFGTQSRFDFEGCPV